MKGLVHIVRAVALYLGVHLASWAMEDDALVEIVFEHWQKASGLDDKEMAHVLKSLLGSAR